MQQRRGSRTRILGKSVKGEREHSDAVKLSGGEGGKGFAGMDQTLGIARSIMHLSGEKDLGRRSV